MQLKRVVTYDGVDYVVWFCAVSPVIEDVGFTDVRDGWYDKGRAMVNYEIEDLTAERDGVKVIDPGLLERIHDAIKDDDGIHCYIEKRFIDDPGHS